MEKGGKQNGSIVLLYAILYCVFEKHLGSKGGWLEEAVFSCSCPGTNYEEMQWAERVAVTVFQLPP